jgi:hypothetical protein
MFLSPYHTTEMLKANPGRYQSSLKQSIRDGLVAQLVGNKVTVLTPKDETTAVFTQPLTNYDIDMGFKAVFDGRLYLKKRNQFPGDEEFIPRSESEWDALVERAAVLGRWLTSEDDRIRLQTIANIPMRVYMDLFTSVLGRRIGLDGIQSLQLTQIVGYYFLCLFGDRADAESNHDTFIYRIAKVSRVDVSEVTRNLAGIEYMSTLDDLASMIQRLIPTPRTAMITSTVMLSTLTNGWFGANAKENMSVALEHPPTWIWLVDQAITSRSYRRTTLGKMIQERLKVADLSQFSNSLKLYRQG